MVAPGYDQGEQASVASDRQLPVIEPLAPFRSCIAAGHIAIKQNNMRAQFAD